MDYDFRATCATGEYSGACICVVPQRVNAVAHLPSHLRGACLAGEPKLPVGLTLAAMEKLLVRDALRRSNGNHAAAARELDIDTSTLFRKVKLLGLGRSSAPG